MRPKLHLTAPQNWINDPNGLLYFQGNYHVFYQHFPYDCKWGTMHWGHAISKDLVTYQHLPIALYPSKDYDRNGCFSGSAITYNDKMYIYYTSIKYAKENPEYIHVQYSDDDLIASQSLVISKDGFTFNNKEDKHLVVDVIKDNSLGDIRHTRDPKVWVGKNNHVYMIVGSKVPSDNGYDGEVLFYESIDGINFKYKNRFIDATIGDMWECPDIFNLDNKYYLVFSPENINHPPQPISNAVYMKVEFDEESCTLTRKDNYEYMDYGLDFYAPQTFLDEENRRVVIGWLRMREPIPEEKWVGMLSFPRVLKSQNGHIYQEVHPNIRNKFKKEVNQCNLQEPFLMKTILKESSILNFGDFIITIQDDCLVCNREKVSIIAEKVCNINKTPVLNHQYALEIYYDCHVFEIYINDGYYVISQIVYDIKDTVKIKDVDPYQIYVME
ncbi:MAG: glycoside hydrolase family 32 protein [Coprobacillaceae bacterium]